MERKADVEDRTIPVTLCHRTKIENESLGVDESERRGRVQRSSVRPGLVSGQPSSRDVADPDVPLVLVSVVVRNQR